MSGVRDANELNGLAENVGSRDHLHGQEQDKQGQGGDGGHLGLGATQKAVRDLVSALEQDGEGWQTEREAWAKERAALKASVAYEEGRVGAMKKETKRLIRVVRETKQENDRLAREASRLREENAGLLARNARLDARNLQVRREIETVSERNRKLLSTLQRELVGNTKSNSADATEGRRAEAAAAAVDLKPVAPAASSVKLEENARSIIVPNSSRGSRDSGSGGGSSSSSTQRRRRRRRSEHSDTEEIVTPRSTAAPGENEPEAPAAAAGTKNNAQNRPSTAVQGEGRVDDGWRMATEAIDSADATRQGAGSAGAPPQQQQRYSDGDQSNPRDGAVRDEPVTGEEGALVVKKDRVGSSRDDEAVPGHRSSPRPSPAAAAGAGAGSAGAGEERRRSEGDGDGASDSSGRATFSAGADIHDAGHREARPLPPPPRPPPTQSAAASTQGKRPAFSPPATSAPRASLPAGRKRSRLSLGGVTDDKGPALTGHSVEITEVLEAPRPRSVAAAGARAGTVHASFDPPSSTRQGTAPERPLVGQAATGARGRASPDVPAAGARRRYVVQSFPGPLSAAERMGSSRGSGTGRRAGGGEFSGDGVRATKLSPGVDEQRAAQKGRQSYAQGSGITSTTARAPRKRPDQAGKNGRRDAAPPCSDDDRGQPGPRDYGWRDKWSTGREGSAEGQERLVVAGGGGGGADSGTTAAAVAHDAIYPRLTMAAVNSPAKKKPRSRQRQQQQQQRPQGAPEPHIPASSSSGRRVGDPTPPAAAAADSGRGRNEKRRQRAHDGAADKDAGRGDAKGRSGAEGDAVEERENSPPRNGAHGGSASRQRSRGPVAAAAPDTHAVSPAKGAGSGGGRSVAAAAAAEVEAPTAGRPVARNHDVVNPYAMGMSGGNEGAAAAAATTTAERGQRTRQSRPAKGYKFQEVVRDRGKRAMMKGHDCEHCSAYLAAVGGSPGEREAMLNLCSRHKYTEENGRPALTPDGFWDLSFADSPHSDSGGARPGDGDGGAGNRRLAGGDKDSLDF